MEQSVRAKKVLQYCSQENGGQGRQANLQSEFPKKVIEEIEVFRLTKNFDDGGEGQEAEDDVYRGAWQDDHMHGYGVYTW